MSKSKFTQADDDLLADLGVEVETKKKADYTPREQRILSGFEEVQGFFEKHNRLPTHEAGDIFERLLAVRFDQLVKQKDCKALLEPKDHQGLFALSLESSEPDLDFDSDDALLDALGVELDSEGAITNLKYVKSRSEKERAKSEIVGERKPCNDFDQFKPLFAAVQRDLKVGRRQTVPFSKDGSIEQGNFFILTGQKAYVADVGEEFTGKDGRKEYRLRVIFDNGVESDQLMRSLQKRLWEDEAGRRITESSSGPLFDLDESDKSNLEAENTSGTIYVLKSLSKHDFVEQHRNLIHKIGVTGGDVKKRIASAKTDPTYLMADVEVIATFKLFDINKNKLENLIHRVFESAQLQIEINDRFGNPVKPREWYLVPFDVIEEAINKIRDGSLVNYIYDPSVAAFKEL